MLVRIFTAFPEYFNETLNVSLLKHSRNDGIWSLEIINLRDYGIGKHKKIDDTTAGGGSGLILRPDVLANALEAKIPDISEINQENSTRKLLLTSPRGIILDQKIANNLSKLSEINIISNRFEGVDQRVIDYYKIQEISIGQYILLGGEVAVCAILESTLRLIDGFLKNDNATEEESFSDIFDGKLEYPQYTQPNLWKNIAIPEILRSGNHKQIKEWRLVNLVKPENIE